MRRQQGYFSFVLSLNKTEYLSYGTFAWSCFTGPLLLGAATDAGGYSIVNWGGGNASLPFLGGLSFIRNSLKVVVTCMPVSF